MSTTQGPASPLGQAIQAHIIKHMPLYNTLAATSRANLRWFARVSYNKRLHDVIVNTHCHYYLRLALAKNRHCGVDLLEALVATGGIRIRNAVFDQAVERCLQFGPAAITAIANTCFPGNPGDSGNFVSRQTASPATQVEHWGYECLDERLQTNPTTPRYDFLTGVIKNLAAHNNATPELLDAIAKDPNSTDIFEIKAVAKNPATSVTTLAYIYIDHPTLRDLISKHHHYPEPNIVAVWALGQ